MARFGLEGRHLRAFRTAADREIGLFTQVVGPMAKQRSSDGRVARRRGRPRLGGPLRCDCTQRLVQIGLRDIVG